MSFQMVFATRPTKEMDDLLRILTFWHIAFSRASKTLIFFESAAFSEALARSDASVACYRIAENDASVACYRIAENVFILPIVESVDEFVQVQRQILPRHVVIDANDSALQQRPEVFNRIRVNFTANVFTGHVVNNSVFVALSLQQVIASRVIGRDQRHVFLHHFMHELLKRLTVGAFDQAANDIAFARDRANNGHFVGTTSDAVALVAMLVFVFAANKRFIDFNDAHQLSELHIGKTSTEPVAHVPRGFVRAFKRPTRQRAVNLKRRDAFLAGQHDVKNLEPLMQFDIRVFKDRHDGERKPIYARMILADPMKRLGFQCVHFRVSALRATHAIRPSALKQIQLARFVVRKKFVEFFDRHLSCDGRLFLRHGGDYARI
jgi:hypothetical protein